MKTKTHSVQINQIGQSGVRVRMYGADQGDCFLLTFPGQGKRSLSVVVDSKPFQGMTDEAQRLKDIARNIADQTGGILDVMVLSGGPGAHFPVCHFAEDISQGMVIQEAWLPWKAEPSNPKAVQLAKDESFLLAALERIKGTPTLDKSEFIALEGLISDVMTLRWVELGPPIQAALGNLTGIAKTVRYLSAGDLLERAGVRYYILSPPRPPTRSAFLEMMTGPMLYDLQRLGHVPSLDLISQEERELIRRELPFDRAESILLSEVPQSSYGTFFRKYFGYEDQPDHGPAWRRIGLPFGWSGIIRFIRNNVLPFSRLAMAVELVESGKVLLFPGDTEEIDWQLWHELAWQVDGGKRQVTFQDLLQRTVFYKVGHHGEYRERLGVPPEELALMTDPQLVAMLALDKPQAKSGDWKKIEGLYHRLGEQTHGRVLWLDKEMLKKPANVAAEEWSQFTKRVNIDPDGLWIEYIIDP